VPTGIDDPADVAFTYDAAGNRTSMTDGTGSVTYGYNALSQLTSEARQFTTLSGHTYTTTSDYTLSGQLKYVIDPVGSRVDYSYDAAGRMLNVAGSGPASASSYASNLQYRAWGALKDVDYGNGSHQFVGYDTRLRASTMELRNVIVNSTNQTPLTMKWNYDYYSDGRLNHAYDLNDNRFDHKIDYDDKGRMKEAYSGREARGLAPTSPADSPFRQTFDYDAFGNMTTRGGRLWKQALFGESSTYTNDRRVGWGYDAAGNIVAGDSSESVYDAAGQQTYSHAPTGGECGGLAFEITQQYDGDGRPAKRSQTKRFSNGGEPPVCTTTEETTYYVYSAALGGTKLLELNADGVKVKGYIYGGGGLLAKQEIYPVFNSSGVKWQHRNPGSASWVETAADRAFERQEMDPLGQETGAFDLFLIIPNPNYSDVHGDTPMFVDGGDPFHLSDGCGDIDGMPASCSEISERARGGTLQNESVVNQGTQGWQTYRDDIVDYGIGLFSTYRYSADGHGEIHPDKFFFTMPQNSLSQGCLDALAEAGRTAAAVDRAYANVDALNKVAGEYNINMLGSKILAAIAIRETGFINRNEMGGGPGRGVFQISVGGVSSKITGDVEASAGWVMKNILAHWYNHYEGRGYSDVLSLAGALRNYNHSNKNDETAGLLDVARNMDDLRVVDNGTAGTEATRYTVIDPNTGKETGEKITAGNYVTNVMQIADNCFNR
jgi:YD repeat-containing protein